MVITQDATKGKTAVTYSLRAASITSKHFRSLGTDTQINFRSASNSLKDRNDG